MKTPKQFFCKHRDSLWDEVKGVKVFRCSNCALVRERDTSDVRKSEPLDPRFRMSWGETFRLRWKAQATSTGPGRPTANVLKARRSA